MSCICTYNGHLASPLCHGPDTSCHLSIIGPFLLQKLGLHFTYVVLVAEHCLLQLSLQSTYLLLLTNLLFL